jgi:hypothetical protein
MVEELMLAQGGIGDLMRYTASWPVLVSARHRVRENLNRSNLITDGELRHLQRLLRQGQFRHDPAWWVEGTQAEKPFVRQHVWEQIIGFALFWTLSAAWVPVRHGSVYGSASGTPIGPHSLFCHAEPRGVLDAVAMLKASLPRPRGPRDGFVVIADGSRTFEHIRHDMIMKRLETRINDPMALDLVADYLQSVQTTEGAGIGRGHPLGIAMADIAFSHVDWNWPEMRARHRVQPCYLSPWRNRPPRTTPEDWMVDFFGDLYDRNGLQTPQVVPDRTRYPDLPHHRAEDGSDQLLTQDTRPDGTIFRHNLVVVDTGATDTREKEEWTMCPTMGSTGSNTRFCGTGPPSSIYLRYVDDCLVAGEGGPRRAAWVQEALDQQYADISVPVNWKKSTVGSLYDGFDFLGIRWKFSRVSGQLELTVSPGRQADIVQEVRGVMWKTFGRDPRNRLAVITATRQTLVDGTQYLRQAGVDDRDIWAEAHDQLQRLARW